MSEPQFKDKFIGFVDILGWKALVEAAEIGVGMPLSSLLEMLKMLGTQEDKEKVEKHGPAICPASKYVQRNLDFKLTQISDCVVVSSEVSPAGAINLVSHCWGAIIRLLTKGIMCRGYITRGLIYHTDGQFIGSGYQEAYINEDQVSAFKRKAEEKGTPFVEVDPVVCDYIRDNSDSCVKEMFSRYVKEDETITALFPFQRLQHSFIIGDFLGRKFDPGKERQANENMRSMIIKMKESVMALTDQSKPDAVSKAEHYIAALDAQIEVYNKTNEMLDILGSSFPPRQI